MDAAVRRFIEAVASWESGYANARPIVDRATELLVDGLGGEAVAVLAGTPAARADHDVWELLPAALVDLDLSWPLGRRDHNAIVTAAIQARRYLAGEITARRLCSLVHQRYGHDTHPLVEALSALDDAYDNVDLVGASEDHVVREIDAAAAELISGSDRLMRGADPDDL